MVIFGYRKTKKVDSEQIVGVDTMKPNNTVGMAIKTMAYMICPQPNLLPHHSPWSSLVTLICLLYPELRKLISSSGPYCSLRLEFSFFPIHHLDLCLKANSSEKSSLIISSNIITVPCLSPCSSHCHSIHFYFLCQACFFFFFIYFYQLEANYFTILQWFLSYIDMNQPWIYMCSPSRSPLPPPSLPDPYGSSLLLMEILPFVFCLLIFCPFTVTEAC